MRSASPRDRRACKQGVDRQRGLEDLLQAGENLHGGKRIAAKLEEIGVNARRVGLQHLGKDLRHAALGRRAGRSLVDRRR